MPGMIPREARGPGARREEEAHRASERAGARRARQGGRGAGHACAGGTLRGCAGACGACPGTSRLVRTGPSEAVGRAPAPPGRGQPSPARPAARAPASRRPAGGPGRRRCCPGSRGARRRRARARHAGPRGVRGRRGASSATSSARSRTGAGRPTRRTASALGAVGEGTSVSTDGLRGYARVPPRACVSRHDATPAREAVRGELGMEVRDAREARGLPGAPRGVSTRRLGHYLDWFLWDEQTRRSDADRADTLSGQAATGSYDNTRFALAREPQPFWSYWEDKLAVSTVV